MFAAGRDGKLGVVGWGFNAWAKYADWSLDSQVADRAREWLHLPGWYPTREGRPIILEGGSIEVNGQGLLLTTEECLLSPIQCRNPGQGRQDYERLFRDYLGAKKVLWLGQGISGDDTHGHVDDLARFVNAWTVVAVLEQNPSDANYVLLRENWERLQGATDAAGSRLEIVALPMPGPVHFAGQRLPASYANFYIANDRVLVPTFNDPSDQKALGILAELFPGRTVVGIHAVDLVWGLGTIHCLTQQQPKAAK
jgi:agmatine deiminase